MNAMTLEAVYYSAPVPRSKAALTVLGLVFDRVHFPNVYLPKEADPAAVAEEISRIANASGRITSETATLLNAMSLIPHLAQLRSFCNFAGADGQVFGGELKEASELSVQLERSVFGPPPDGFTPVWSNGYHKGLPGGDYIDFPGEWMYPANAIVYSARHGFPLINDTNLPMLPLEGGADRVQSLASLLALRCVEFVLPVVPPLNPSELVELRVELEPHLKAFRASVARLAVNLEALLLGDADDAEIQRKADYLVRTEVAATFGDLQRKLQSNKLWTLENAMHGAIAASVGAAAQSMAGAVAGVLGSLGLLGLKLRNQSREIERSGLFYLLKLQQLTQARRMP